MDMYFFFSPSFKNIYISASQEKGLAGRAIYFWVVVVVGKERKKIIEDVNEVSSSMKEVQSLYFGRREKKGSPRSAYRWALTHDNKLIATRNTRRSSVTDFSSSSSPP